MDIKTKSKIVSVILVSLGGLIVLAFIIAMIFRFIIGPPADPTIDDGIERMSAVEVIQVNVLNSSGIKGLAAKTRDYLRSKGFDVVDIGNYHNETDSSFVIDRLGDLSSAKKVAGVMGIPDTLVFTEIDSSLFLRCTIVIGKNYNILIPYGQ